MSEYKLAKEAFVSGQTGGTVLRINAVCTTALTTYALWIVLAPQIGNRANTTSLRVPIAEFAILVVPLLLALTILSAHPFKLNLALTFLIIFFRHRADASSPPALSPVVRARAFSPKPSDPPPTRPETRLFLKPFVTVYRAHMMIMTVICILAVDFAVFPREFAKAETWGTSVEHSSEYGIHWNFFFTLGLVPIFGTVFDRLSRGVDHSWMGFIITLVHQLLLDQTDLQYWALTAERNTFLTQNREGIVSLPGYLAIYLLGTATGLYVLPPDPYFFDRLQALRPNRKGPPVTPEKKKEREARMQKAWKHKPGKLASVLGSYAILWWMLYGVMMLCGWSVSRRLANMAYVVWVAAFNASFLFGYLLVSMWSSATLLSDSDSSTSPNAVPIPSTSAPAIFDAINRNSLVVFLVANLLTGLVNVSMQSMYASDLLALVVLLLYCGACVGAAWALRKKRLRI
ncbi:glucosaminylphosphatidylinositol acyltransferase, partial [Phenoliferia sp. Uapishka_3]